MTYSIIQKSQLEGVDRIDADYYRSEYILLQNKLNNLKTDTLNKLTAKIGVGFVSSMTNHFQENGIPLLRTQNVGEFILNLDRDMVHIDKDFHRKLNKSQVKSGQVLLARSGSIGKASVVPRDFPIANSADIILIDTKTNLLPEFLTAFINSKYGQFQIERGASGGVQGHMNLFSLEKLLVPVFNLKIQENIKILVDEIFIANKEAKEYYQQAEDLLLKELGLLDFKPQNDLSFVVNYSDVEKAERCDADYFQPKYIKLLSTIQQYNSWCLGSLVSIQTGFEPGSEAYQEEGKSFIRVSNLSKNGIEVSSQKYLSEELYQKLKDNYQPKIGEILLTKDATPGIAYVIKDSVEGLISSGILKLKLKDNNLESEYLALCLNSVIGKLQSERDAGGSIIVHWKSEQIKNVLIPFLPRETQRKISELVIKSHEARKKSKELLEEAKRKVEEMIEKGEQ